MLTEIEPVLAAGGGAAHRDNLLTVVSRGRLNHEIRSGRLTAPFAHVLCRPWDADQRDVRHRAAVLSVGRPAALSHVSCLWHWSLIEDLLADVDETVHVTVPHRRSIRSQRGLSVHRARVLPKVANSAGLLVVSPADAVVGSWPLLAEPDRRGPAIAAVRNRLLTPQELLAALPRHPRIAGRDQLRTLLALLVAGCESELEIWGCLEVFDVPGLRHGVRQRWVRVGGERFRLDLSYDAERVAVELDGERWHSTREQRERDRRRDAKLATIGWVTLRFSRQRLVHDVSGCRADTLATLAARGEPLGG